MFVVSYDFLPLLIVLDKYGQTGTLSNILYTDGMHHLFFCQLRSLICVTSIMVLCLSLWCDGLTHVVVFFCLIDVA